MKEIHDKSIIIDSLAGVHAIDFNEDYVMKLSKGGITGIHLTIPGAECFYLSEAVKELAFFFKQLNKLKPFGIKVVTTVEDIIKAKKEGTVAVILGSQTSTFLGLDLNNLSFFASLGMRIMQPTYQQRNQFGNGCGEKVDSGLSNLGVQWVEEMNELGVIISLSHVGYKTSMEIIDISKDPVIFDHSNPKKLCNVPRNLTDDQIQACAEKEGVIGLTPLAMFLHKDKGPTDLGVDDYINHIDYIAELVGVDHVGIGTDLAEGYFQTPFEILERRRLYPKLTSKWNRKIDDEFLASGRDKLFFYEKHMPWWKSVTETPIITEALHCRGYSNQDIEKILGKNFLRVFNKVW